MTKRKKIAVIFGTRPEAIKLASVIEELRAREEFTVSVCVTAQHRGLLDRVMQDFAISPDYDLDLMREGQDLFDLTAAVLTGLRSVFQKDAPDLALVHGDTTTAFAAALACFYLKIPVAHVEAGLRTYELSSPFPEEWNRQAIGRLARYHFAPTERARENLLRESVPSERILVTGNTGLDLLRRTVRADYSHPLLTWARDGRLVLLTAHRREALGEPMARCFRGIRRVADAFPEVRIVYPVHPNPAVRTIAEEAFGGCEQIRLTEPMDTVAFHNFLARCEFVLTDSGGIQEEGMALHKPVLVLRNETERQEGLTAGGIRLIGTGEESVDRGMRALLENPALAHAMSRAQNPFGDGYAARRIADFLENTL